MQPTLLDVFAAAPAGELIARLLGDGDRLSRLERQHLGLPDARRAARLAHRSLRDAVDATVTRLVLSSHGPSANANRALLVEAAARFPNVRYLKIIGGYFNADGMRSLASVAWKLERLDTWHADFDDNATALLLSSMASTLQELNFFYTNSGRGLAAAPLMRLRTLRLTGLRTAYIASLAAAPWFDGLEELSLDGVSTYPGNEDLDALTALARLGACGLRTLKLCGYTFRAAGLAVLLRGRWPALEKLTFCVCHIRLSDSVLFGASFDMPRLRKLDMRYNRIGVEGARLLARSLREQLEVLNLERTDLCDDDLAELAAGGPWRSLTHLRCVSGNPLVTTLRADSSAGSLDVVREWAPKIECLA
jgi:hypothetical protein